MKKILYLLCFTSAFTFASCSTDTKGYSYETEHSNDDENVNPNHIRTYADIRPGEIKGFKTNAGTMYGFTPTVINNMRDNLGSDAAVATRMVYVYYDPSREMADLLKTYHSASSAQSAEPTQNDMGSGISNTDSTNTEERNSNVSEVSPVE
ncbi:hypothetical protein ACFSKU_10430 [Pontibacter silvestris]|uniref:DUF4296 domain-containing protein n=1 Tax=Pontibacter silvestris TaxID=2305183 RepID=A0ABW4WX37_9BACT|nr:hypothetical protein [Pontibacter silvestris]MCC9136748.1 hypothetical protein [Pontibacter silvestris]